MTSTDTIAQLHSREDPRNLGAPPFAPEPSGEHVAVRPGTDLLGLTFERATMEQALEMCVSWCSGPRLPHTVLTANAAILCMMRHDRELAEACHGADAVVADGMSVVWSSRTTETPLPERVAGVDLMARLLEAGGDRKLSVYFLGAKPEVVSHLVEESRRLFPGLRVVGFRDGYFPASMHDEVVGEINNLAPDMLFVGMPSPFKEVFLHRYRDRLGVPVMIGVGGSFDVLAGFVRRAPRWVRSIGMEWSWRLAMEPRKLWKRYLATNSEFLLLVARDVLARRSLGRTRAARRARQDRETVRP